MNIWANVVLFSERFFYPYYIVSYIEFSTKMRTAALFSITVAKEEQEELCDLTERESEMSITQLF